MDQCCRQTDDATVLPFYHHACQLLLPPGFTTTTTTTLVPYYLVPTDGFLDGPWTSPPFPGVVGNQDTVTGLLPGPLPDPHGGRTHILWCLSFFPCCARARGERKENIAPDASPLPFCLKCPGGTGLTGPWKAGELACGGSAVGPAHRPPPQGAREPAGLCAPQCFPLMIPQWDSSRLPACFHAQDRPACRFLADPAFACPPLPPPLTPWDPCLPACRRTEDLQTTTQAGVATWATGSHPPARVGKLWVACLSGDHPPQVMEGWEANSNYY